MERDPLTHRIIGCAIEVHRELGPGLLESAYERCLGIELAAQGVEHKIQVEMPVTYKGETIDCGYRVDVFVEDGAIVELKCVDKILPIHEAQLLTYMKLAGVKKGLIINFNVLVLKDGVRRMVL